MPAENPEEHRALNIVGDRIRNWWLTVLAGQIQQSHPVQGTNLNAHVAGDTLYVSGQLPSEQDRAEVEREVEHLAGQGVRHVQTDLTVAAVRDAQPGLLTQTLLGVFEGPDAAEFAQGYLEGHARVPQAATQVIHDTDPQGPGRLAELLPESYREEAEQQLRAGRSLLILTVDETEAFQVRELLDEETRSLQTLVLPPLAATDGTPSRQGRSDDGAGLLRRATRERERSLHD